MDGATDIPPCVGRASLLSAVFSLFLLLLPPFALAASSDSPDETSSNDTNADEPAPRVAVVALDDTTEVGALTKSTSALLDAEKYDVVAGERLERQLDEHRAPEISDELASKFAGLANTVGDGVKSFFYKGNETAVERLSPIFDLGMGHPEVLARRPDFAEQIFQAGLVLVRAYRRLEQQDNAEAAASLLVRRMPASDPAPSTAPPKIIRFFEAQREALAERETRLAVEQVGNDGDCTTYVNGSTLEETDRTLVVAPDEPYYLRLECGRAETPVWKTTLPAGETTRVPISGRDPLAFSMVRANFRQRRLAEAHLRLVAHWTGIDRVLGVYGVPDSSEEKSALVVHVGPDGDANWSDTVDRGEIRGAIARVMPELDPDATPERAAVPRRQTDRAHWLDWTLTGLGAVGLTGGTYLAVVTERRARRIQCATGARSDCDGLAPLQFDTSAEADRAEREVNGARAGYIAALAAGAGLATWGIVRLATRPDARPERATRSPRLGLAPTPRGPRIFLQTDW